VIPVSDLDKRYNAHFSREENQPGVSTYFDTWEEFADLVKHYAPTMRCWWVAEGYGEHEYIDSSPTQFGGTITTRRTSRMVPESEWGGDPRE
jgi:hypothetical protein